jgi:predicted dehydrogenase
VARELVGVACPTFTNFDQMCDQVKPDLLMVTTVDGFHSQYIVKALDRGIDVLTEKPMVINEQQCQAVLDAEKRNKRKITVTFNYRYAPKHQLIKETLLSGEIGRVVSVDFSWYLDVYHGADYFRRWHREKANSGGLLVHKSSHHFDLVNWWLGDVPRTVHAQGALAFYGEVGAARRGGTRPARSHRAPGLGTDPFLVDLGSDPRLRALYLDAEGEDGYLRDRDVFAPGISIEDNLAVLARYTRGALLTYSLNAHAPWEGYRVAFNGTEGRLELSVCERAATRRPGTATGQALRVDPSVDPDAAHAGGSGPDSRVRVAGDRLVLQRHWEPAVELDIRQLAACDPARPPRGGAHGGGDALLLADVFVTAAQVGPDPLGRAAGHLDGIRSALVGIAANRSIATGTVVDYAALADLVGLSGRSTSAR